MKWNEIKWISSAIVHPKINMICVNVRFCADKNRRHPNKLCHHHHLDADGASVQLSFIHKNVTETCWWNVTRPLAHTPIILSHSTKIKRNIIQIHGIIASSTSLCPCLLFFPFGCSTVANQLDRYIMLITFSFDQNQIFISLFRSIWEIKDERNMVPEILQGKYGAKKVKIADITVQQMLFEKLRKLRGNFFSRQKKHKQK